MGHDLIVEQAAAPIRRGSSASSGLPATRPKVQPGWHASFAVDLFNDGLDLPQVDTNLLLMPTQSATIFLQHLRRGLRRAGG